MPQTVLLTGITGFIAKHIARELLQQGYAVRGSLRVPARAAEVRAALGVSKEDARLHFVTLDLNRDDGWDEAMAGVDALIHCASPFPLANPKSADDVIRPAVDGTLRALTAARQAGVGRVVLTSSIVAMMYNAALGQRAFGPGDWTDLTHPSASPYVQSKTMAERAAWDFVAANPTLRMTAINPGFVLGTPLDAQYGTSLSVVERVLLGGDPVQPNIGFPVVDVADVARLHVAALVRPETVGQRVVAAADTWSFPQIGALLKGLYPDRKIATRVAPMVLLRLLALIDPAVRAILPNVGRLGQADNAATRALFEMEFTPGEAAIKAAAAAVLEHKG